MTIAVRDAGGWPSAVATATLPLVAPRRATGARSRGPYQRILAAIDGTEISGRVVTEAARLARSQHGHLRVLHIAPGGLTADADIVAGAAEPLAQGRRLLGAALAHARRLGVEADVVLLDAADRRCVRLIVTEAARCQADLIVLGTHTSGAVSPLFLGHVAEGVARTAPVPVLLVRGVDRGAMSLS